MTLDLPTLMTMESFVSACAGALLLAAWTQNRRESALAIWGASDLAAAAGVIFIMLGATSERPIFSMAGGGALLVAAALVWTAAQALDRRRTPLPLAFGGAVLVTAAPGVFPPAAAVAGSLSLATSAVFTFAASFTLWRGRAERLPARLPLVMLAALHACMLTVGAWSPVPDRSGPDQLAPLTSAFGLIHFESIVFALGAAVFLLALVKERGEAASRAAADIDSLTGVANRAAFMAKAEKAITRCRTERAPVSMMMFDLDRFKMVNDTHGHAVGDAVLQKFCAVALAALRPKEVMGRIGGEEFAVVLPGSSVEAAAIRAERVRAAFAAASRFVDNVQVNATVSCGVSASADGVHTLRDLLANSDRALYRAKAEGRNCVRRAEPLTPDTAVSKTPRIA